MQTFFKTLTLIAVLFSNLSCTSRISYLSINGFEHYVKMFEEEAAARGFKIKVRSLIINWGTLDPDTLGQCLDLEVIPVVTIDPAKFIHLASEAQEELMMHELGHCLLGLDHNDDSLAIMNTYSMNWYSYKQNRKALLDDLFK